MGGRAGEKQKAKCSKGCPLVPKWQQTVEVATVPWDCTGPVRIGEACEGMTSIDPGTHHAILPQ